MSRNREQAVQFGPYRVYPGQRLIVEHDRPLRLGRRAMDILLVLLERPGEVIGKQQLLARVWPDSVVEEISLRVHIAALRKALGDGQGGQRYIVTVAQRGYSFVATLAQARELPAPASGEVRHNLPPRRTRLIGRQVLVNQLLGQLTRQRLLTLAGPGGIGKTTVALRVAEQLLGHYDDGIRLLDLSPLNSPSTIVSNLAGVLGLTLPEQAPLDALCAWLRERHLLLLIDNAEHLVDSVATLVEHLLRCAPRLQILVTSRESLRAEGECLQRLQALDCPVVDAPLEPHAALGFGAVQLFVERAMASRESFELTPDNLATVIAICRHLDGIPLALELAAAQLDSLGLDSLLADLRRHLVPSASDEQRQHLLAATLDWSFQLLADSERTCLRRLSVFRGAFSLASAQALAAGERLAPEQVLDAVSQLVGKSLLNVDVGDEDVFYRMLDTTRCYALGKLQQAGELPAAQKRHAERCLAVMQQAEGEWAQTAAEQWLERYSRGLDDLRAALEWSFASGDAGLLGARLTAASAPLWQELSLLAEHGRHIRKALRRLDSEAHPGWRLHIDLKLAMGTFSYHGQGGSAQTLEAFASARELAERHGDLPGQLRAISGHMAVDLYRGEYRQALRLSRDFDQRGPAADPLLALSAQRLRGLGLHFSGDQAGARREAEDALQRMAHSGRLNRFTQGFGVQYDQSVAALTLLARILWLQGLPEQAARTADQALNLALQINHGTTLCYTLALSGCVIPWYNGERDLARERVALLREQSLRHALWLFQDWAGHYAQALEDAAPLPSSAQGLLGDLLATLVPGRVDAGQLARAHSGEAGWASAALLCAQAAGLLADDQRQQAEALLLKALGIARRQQALAWELRSASALAQLWLDDGRPLPARQLLAPVYARFSEGFASRELVEAGHLLQRLPAREKSPSRYAG
ncbi:ATP-binding protein [Pseudomonas sp. zfem002]|uniref:ATP-binding protein n=1 Tax=Pseudomonas sp. zfem002 TaxID=3078197 RepID=UPI0029287412|nr:winged helix-turn-helix domain-containing protein [Pseudomonas sp. zfem002]MDU9393819.1 winged helix-turn-helix domain-containing protein [Pseudomonas sp. zfem002]